MADTLRFYSANPEKLKSVLDVEKNIEVVVIDEIQKVPELLSVVHYLIEEDRPLQFILTGSSSRKLKKAGVNLLAGRALKKSLHPFIALELGSAFTLEKALKLGMLPVIWGSPDKEDALDAYISLYIQEEVQFEGLVRNIGNFSRFLSVIAFSHGASLNVNNVANECEVKRNTVSEYIQILQDLLLASLIPVFTKRAQRTLISHPKFYLFDAGVFRSLRKVGPANANSEIDGITLEGLIFQHLNAWCNYSKGTWEVFYWRTKAGLEVDFIVYGKDGFWAIEVKNSTKVFSKDLRGLLHFKEDYPECKTILLYRGKERLLEKDIPCVPCETFLKELTPNKPLF